MNFTITYLIFLSVLRLFLKCFRFDFNSIHFKGGSFMDYLSTFREMISLRGLTAHTVKSYSTYIRAYLDYLQQFLNKSPEDVSWDELRGFIRWLKDSKSLSDRTINAAISQLRFFTIYVLHRTWDPTQLPMRKFDQFLPFVPSQQEVQTFISTIPDLKQKAMVALMYSSGLRIGEVCSLRYQDIERKNMRIHVTHGKTRSDRYAILSSSALDILTQYWFSCGRPTDWLFPKQNSSNGPIDTFYLSRHIHEHEERLGWEKRLTCHSFRHAFGTHLYENGADLLTIQSLLGHKSLNSTTLYVHLAQSSLRSVKSPFDTFGGSCNE